MLKNKKNLKDNMLKHCKFQNKISYKIKINNKTMRKLLIYYYMKMWI